MRSLRGITISSRVLNFGMFAHPTKLISRLYNIYFGLPYLSQESMVLSQLQLAYLCYLELPLSLTKLQNYNLCKSLNLTPLKDHEFMIYLLIYSNKLAYLQLITVLVYGSSPPKSHEQGYLNF